MCVFRVPYQDIFGGATAFTRQHFRLVNGFSNQYYGWGGEDDDIFKRLDMCTFHLLPLTPRFSPSLPQLKQLHCLPVNYRIKSTLSTLNISRSGNTINHLIWLVSCTFLTSPDNSDHLPHTGVDLKQNFW